MMTIDNDKHIRLIQNELLYQSKEFKKLLKKQATKLFVEKKLFICRYQGYDEVRGNVIVKFDNKASFTPRRNETLLCFVSSIQNDNVKNWGGLTYEDLRTSVVIKFECRTVFFKYEKESTIVGLSGVQVEDVEKFERNALVFLGPNDPPLGYLANLENFLKQLKANSSDLLALNIDNPRWNPEPLRVNENIVARLQSDFLETDSIIIQGPPGTGKTYLMALLCSELIKSNSNVLVTALTNRALIELAEKPHLKSSLEQGKVFKSALTAEESKIKSIKGIQSFKSLSKQQPSLLLTTYYVMSQIAIKVMDEYFDYIIVEEASQAFLSTLALAKKLGKKCIIIGDIKQLEPIFHTEYTPEDPNNYHWMICGLKAISFFLPKAKQYILTESYRLTENAITSTNLFYGNVLSSKSDLKLPLDFSRFPELKKYLNANGGSSLVKFNLPKGIFPSSECSDFIVKQIEQINEYNDNVEIAVLSFYKDTVSFLQDKINSIRPSEKVLIETVDRIQGLTTDFCIFFVPLEAVPFALKLNRFNVATSRAKCCTLIITDLTISSFFPLVDKEVKEYLLSINTLIHEANKTDNFRDTTGVVNEDKSEMSGVKIVGKIDLSKFEKPKKEINKDKENIYIIDTNIFVNCPDIISRIDACYKIVLSAKVIEELDNLKLSLTAEQKRNVQKALRNINSSMEKRNIKIDTADLTLLPKDFNKKSPDNFILSVALRYKDDNPIMLTSDNGLQVKSKTLSITTINLKDFLRQKKYNNG